MRRRVARWAGLFALSYAVVCAGAFLAQRRLVYPVPDEGRASTKNVELAPGGVPVLWFAPQSDGAPVVVHFHGNAEHIGMLRALGQLCQLHGLDFAAPEYPGYGLAQHLAGPDEGAILASAEAALHWLTDAKGVGRERLVLSGQSLGTGVAVQLAARGWGGRLVLLSPYSSLVEVGERAFPFLPVRWLATERFDSYSAAPRVHVPVLLIHGEADEVVPFDLGQRLGTQFERLERLDVPNGHHNDLWERPGVEDAYFAFVAQRGAARRPVGEAVGASQGVTVDAVATCPTSKIAFAQSQGCLNDGSVEFCLAKGDNATLDAIRAFAPNVGCATSAGRAQCDTATQVLCLVPTRGDNCVATHGALTDSAWARLCRIAAQPAVTRIVATWAE